MMRLPCQPRGRAIGLTLLGALLCLACIGCTSDRPVRYVWPDQRDTLAMPGQKQRALQRQSPARPGLPWYAVRNEYKPTVTAGVELPTLERSVTQTVDRQRVINGRVRDHYRTTTYRERVRRTVR